MYPVELLILLSHCDDDALVVMECHSTNMVTHVIQVSYTDDCGKHKYAYLCDDIEYVSECLINDSEEGRLSNLVIKEVTK